MKDQQWEKLRLNLSNALHCRRKLLVAYYPPPLLLPKPDKEVSQTGTMFLKCFGLSPSNHSSSSHTQRPYPTAIEELCHQFSLSHIMKSTDNFDKNKIIGEGGFGTVFKGCFQHNDGSDYTVALERMNKGNPQGWEEFKNEIERNAM
ncbi:hypothetical protein RJT34_18425 [Clitoria ternatea]|uniref:Protein kinase domain-containing protein n=1 Tax=Clitoria ternatea TaxID=43366 RepID=A0AAN9JCB1_CLITE